MKNKINAMTLVELVCVVAILAILIAIGMISLKGVRLFKAERQIHAITGELRDLRHQAMVERESTSMLFSKEAYVRKTEKKAISVPYEEALKFIGFSTSDGYANFTFSSSGRPSNSGTVIFQIGGKTYHVVVAPVNGRIRMEKVNEKE